jgi:signal transduction histidine kinase
MQLIDRFLKVSRLESANIRVDKVSTDLNKMLKPICASFKSQLDEKKLDLIVNAESVPVVNANSDMIQDVIKNLISNAIKYGPTSRAIYIALWATQSHVNLSVTDHGYGISDEHMTKIFQKFYRINEYSKEKGTGLGLSYVKEVIKKHDGEVNVESNPDIGSRFTISLPIS